MRRIVYPSLILLALLSVGCWRPAGLGIGGRYVEARDEFVGRGGNFDKAIANLEYIASRDPLYKETLTLLGRAYYNRKRYEDAFKILKRAVAVNSKDEIAWMALGLTQLRLGNDENGLENLKGGITLLSQATRNGYKDVEDWDKSGLVRVSIRRAVLSITKGLEAKREIVRNCEIVLRRVDNELAEGKREEYLDRMDTAE